MGNCDRLEVQDLDREIRTDDYLELHGNGCFSGKSAAEGYEDQMSLRTRPSCFEQVTVVTIEKSGVNVND